MSDWDWTRTLTMVLYAMLVGQTLAIVWFYFRARHREIKAGVPNPPGLIPVHVILIGLTYLYWSGLGVYENVTRLGSPATFYALGNPIAMVISNVALYLIANYGHRRYRATR